MIKTGLNANDKLVITPLGQVSSGTQVSILGEQSADQPKSRGANGQGKGKRPTPEQLEQKAKELGISVEELKNAVQQSKEISHDSLVCQKPCCS